MFSDPWLNRWLPLVKERAAGAPTLEIGCGHGDDTAVLVKAGLDVVAFDLSALSVGIARTRVPSAQIQCQDIREPFPALPKAPGVVVASLSLHYFDWKQTIEIVGRIHALLKPGGVLMCRLNSTEDNNFGAQGHAEIEPNFYSVNGEPKRFFDQASVDELFAIGWNSLSVEHMTTSKYVRSKALWEAVLEKAG
jgi:SAM-dependent methyltransferase